MPAFEVGSDNTFEIKIYFALSPYTNFSHSRYMHIKVVDQQTNQNALIYNSGLKLNAEVQIDSTRQGDDKYYVTLSSTEFKNFSPFKYYKVQLRSCAYKSSNNDSIGQLYRETAIYSEWSTVLLIKGITRPKLKIKYFTNSSNTEGVLFKSNTVSVNGEIVFQAEEDNYTIRLPEDIKTYRIKFYDSSDQMIDDSGDLYPPSTNLRAIHYDAQYLFNPDTAYTMKVEVMTTSYFSFVETFTFSVANSPYTDIFEGQIQKDEDNGLVNIHIEPATNNIPDKTLIYIRRTDSNSNFKVWKDVFSTLYTQGSGGWIFDWKDNTVESGVWYKYGLQYISPNTGGIRTNNKVLLCRDFAEKENSVLGHKDGEQWDRESGQINPPAEESLEKPDKIMLIFEDVFLTGSGGQQLKITYDNSLDSLKYTQYISKTDTIGSKYPFIRQNSATCYRTFPIGGLVTALTNYDNQLFISEKDLFTNEEIYQFYKDYNNDNNITEYNDYIKEREFREAVMAFLIKDDVKLYRSTTEGNILVKLIDVSFTPKQELGRYIYSFSATAVECGDCTIENYAKYNLQKRSEEGYELISSIVVPIYEVSSEDILANGYFNSNIEVSGNLKENLMSVYENGWQISSTGYIEDPEGNMTPVDNLDLAQIKIEYTLSDVRPYKLYFEFLDNPVQLSDGTSGWNFLITTDNGEEIPYVVTTQMKTYNLESDEAMTFNSLTFPYAENQPAHINIIADALLIYKKDMYKKEGGEWVPQIEGDVDPTATIGGAVTYTIKKLTAISASDIDNSWTNKNFVQIAKTKENLELRDETLVSFDIYSLEAIDFPKNTIFKMDYNDNSSDYVYVQTTGNLRINLDNDTSDPLMKFNAISIIGQLISTNEYLTGPGYLLSSNKIQYNVEDEKWYWVINENEKYQVKFYEDLLLSTEVAKGQALYGVIEGYLASGTVPSVLLYGKVGIQEG